MHLQCGNIGWRYPWAMPTAVLCPYRAGYALCRMVLSSLEMAVDEVCPYRAGNSYKKYCD